MSSRHPIRHISGRCQTRKASWKTRNQERDTMPRNARKGRTHFGIAQGPLASCKEFKQRRRLRSHGEIEEEGQEEGSQAKDNQEGGSGCFPTCNHIRRSSGLYNHILWLRADGSTSYFLLRKR